MNKDYMIEAIKEAKKAYLEDEVPVGCVIVKDGKIVARAHNRKEKRNCAVFHAEIECIEKAAKKLKNWNLTGCDLYVTLEPCMMCTGAIINSRIDNIYFGCMDPKGGALVSNIKLNEIKKLNHYPKIHQGSHEEETSLILKSFFKAKRQ